MKHLQMGRMRTGEGRFALYLHFNIRRALKLAQLCREHVTVLSWLWWAMMENDVFIIFIVLHRFQCATLLIDLNAAVYWLNFGTVWLEFQRASLFVANNAWVCVWKNTKYATHRNPINYWHSVLNGSFNRVYSLTHFKHWAMVRITLPARA